MKSAKHPSFWYGPEPVRHVRKTFLLNPSIERKIPQISLSLSLFPIDIELVRFHVRVRHVILSRNVQRVGMRISYFHPFVHCKAFLYRVQPQLPNVSTFFFFEIFPFAIIFICFDYHPKRAKKPFFECIRLWP